MDGTVVGVVLVIVNLVPFAFAILRRSSRIELPDVQSSTIDQLLGGGI